MEYSKTFEKHERVLDIAKTLEECKEIRKTKIHMRTV